MQRKLLREFTGRRGDPLASAGRARARGGYAVPAKDAAISSHDCSLDAGKVSMTL